MNYRISIRANRNVPTSFLAGCVMLGLSQGVYAQQGSDDAAQTMRSGALEEPAKNDTGKRLRLRIGDDRIDEVSSNFAYRVNNGLALIKGTLKLWLPNGATGLDQVTAPGALITATFTHQGEADPYAECELAFDRIVAGPKAEYAFVVKQTGKVDAPRLRLRKGSCDVDPEAVGLQPGVPAARKGDQVAVELHDAADVNHVPLGQGRLK